MTIGDEMLGLWSRPIRAGTLKYLGLSLLDAPSVLVAMYRFTRFWNLLLDDYALQLSRQNQLVTITLRPLSDATAPTIFGHELMVKLIHGVASWLVGRELPIETLGFGFARPAHFMEYAQLFPGPVSFDQSCTSVSFSEQVLRQGFHRSKGELLKFVQRAPDDWIFVTFDHGPTSTRVRAYLLASAAADQSLDAVAAALFMSGRSLSRGLALEGGAFQKIKDEVRRDLAIERLVKTNESIDEIAALAGFDNTPAFHRAFRAWTGSTPGAYRRPTLLQAP
ncbi:MAG: AraC family transcriptional regulator [Rhodoferax sp.]